MNMHWRLAASLNAAGRSKGSIGSGAKMFVYPVEGTTFIYSLFPTSLYLYKHWAVETLKFSRNALYMKNRQNVTALETFVFFLCVRN